VSRVDRVISTVYPLYRHNTKDRSLGVGSDITVVNSWS